MLMVISPAKTLDYDVDTPTRHTLPRHLPQTQELVSQLRDFSPDEIADLMHISDKLAALNHQRYQDFPDELTPDNAKQALLVFQGDVYIGIEAAKYTTDDLAYAQQHLRILSGLYGLLRPLDLMFPYRLEMGTKLGNDNGRNLYDFWGSQLAEQLNTDFKDTPCLVNLASNEYFKAIDAKSLKAPVIDIAFKENKNGTYKVIAIHAKRARGLMVDYAVQHRIADPEGLKAFDVEGYAYSEELSEGDSWVFWRG